MQYLIFSIGGTKLASYSNKEDAMTFAEVYCRGEIGRTVQVCAVIADVTGHAQVTVKRHE